MKRPYLVKVLGLILAASLTVTPVYAAEESARQAGTATAETAIEAEDISEQESAAEGPEAQGNTEVEKEPETTEETQAEIGQENGTAAPEDAGPQEAPEQNEPEAGQKDTEQSVEDTDKQEDAGAGTEAAKDEIGQEALIEKETDEVITESAVSEDGNSPMYGFQQISGATYYFDEKTGVKKTDTWIQPRSGEYYRLGSDGKVLKGIQTVSGKTYFLDEKTGIRKQGGWVTAQNGNRYHVDGSGVIQTGWQDIGSRRYYFMDEKYCGYKKENRGAQMFGFRTIDGKKYYLMDEDCSGYKPSIRGCLLSGFRTINGKDYYLADKRMSGYKEKYHGEVASGFRTISDRLYHFSTSGIMDKGFLKASGKIYYFGDNGAQRTGWLSIGDEKYYLMKDGTALTGWKEISGKKYYFGKDNAPKKYLQIINSRVYYFGSSGALNGTYNRGAEHFLALPASTKSKAVEAAGGLLDYITGEKDTYSLFYKYKGGLSYEEYKKIRDAILKTWFYNGDYVMNIYDRGSNMIYQGGPKGDWIVIRNPYHDSMSPREKAVYIMNREKDLDETLNKKLKAAGVTSSMSDSEKVRKIADYIKKTIGYDNARYYGTIEQVPLNDVIKKGRGICYDYCAYFYYLCDKAGLKCRIVTGTADGDDADDGHAWNQVKVNGAWKYIDVCWYDLAGEKYYLRGSLWGDHRQYYTVREN